MGKPTKVEHEGKMVLAEDLTFDTDKEPWTTYTLEDGTILKIKYALAKVCRLTDTFKPDGEPIYVFQVGGLTHIEAPEHLKKKVKV